MKIIKRFLAYLLAVLMITTLLPTSIFAEDEYETESVDVLSDGYYCVPVSYSDYNSNSTGNCYGDLYRTALVHSADGKLSVTLRVGNYNETTKLIKILKDEYYDYFDNQQLFLLSAKVKRFSQDEFDNDEYWREVSITQDNNLGFADIEFEITDIQKPVIMAKSQPGNYYMKEFPAWMIQVKLDYSRAERLSELAELKSGKWYFELEGVDEISISSGSPSIGYNTPMRDSSGAKKGLRALFEPDADVAINGNVAEATVKLSDNGIRNFVSLYQCRMDTDASYTPQGEDSSLIIYPNDLSCYVERMKSDTNTLTFQYDLSDYKDIAFGNTIIVMGNGHDETHVCSSGARYYIGVMRLKQSAIKSVHLEKKVISEDGSGSEEELLFQLDSTTSSMPDEALLEFSVSEVVDGEDYTKAKTYMDTIARDWKMYEIRLKDSFGFRSDQLGELSTLTVPISTAYVAPHIYYAQRKVTSANGKRFRINISEISASQANGSFTFSTDKLGYYIVSDTFSFDTFGNTLTDDGLYQLNAVIYHMVNRTPSMANEALVKPVTVAVKDGKKYLHIEMDPVSFTNAKGYMGKLWFYKAGYTLKDTGYPEGDLQEAYIAEYQKTEAGEYILDGKHTGPSGYCGKKLFFELPDDNPVVPVQVYVSAMDTDYTNGRADCRLCLDYSSATKIDDTTELPTVETALRAAEEAAETAKEADYTSATYTALANAEATAKSVLDNAEATEEAQSDAYFALRDAIEALTPVENISLDNGLYTAAAKIEGGTDESIDAESRVLKSDDSCALRVTSDKITALRVYDPSTGEYKNAVKNDSTNAFDVTVSGLSSETQVQYATAENPGDGDYTNGRISWTEDFTKAEVSKTELESSIKDAEELVEKAGKDADKYNADDVAALETALAAAHVTDQDSLAVQSEVDAANEALKAAAEQASLGANISDIKAVLDSLKALDETAYTPASWSALETAAAAANEVLADANAGKTVSAAKAAETLSSLNAAKDALITKGDKTALQALYDEASAIKDDGQEGYAAFRTALDNAKAVIDDENAAQSTVDAAKDTLELAVDNLYGGIDKTALQSSYDEINGKRTGGELDGYTDESLALLDAALTNASETLENANATQQEISGAAELLAKAQDALILKTADTDIPVGTYEITGRVRHASQDQDSMSNAALEEPLTIRVTEKEDGTKEARLYMNFRPLTILSMQGYLANLSYYPDAHDANTIPTTGAVAATTEETYAGVYDSYNDPENGTDANVKGKEYPKTMSIPLTWNDSLVWLQVYVPVMEGISRGTGTQNAKLVLDWSTLKQTAGAYDDDAAAQSAKASLAAAIDAANALNAEAVSSDKWTDAEKNVLTAAIAAGNAAHDSLNLDADAVNKVTDAVTAAQNIFSTGSETADKTALKAAIDAANEKLGDKDHTWEPSGKAYLASVISGANTVYASSRASEGQIANWVNALKTATDNLRAVADKTALKAALDDTENYLKDTASYTAADLNALQKLYDDAEAVYEKDDVTQEEADAQANVLTSAVKNLKKVGDVKVVKDGLHDMIVAASGLAGNDAPYTDDSLENLNKAITAADKVYHDADATQEEVNAQSANLSEAIRALKVKKAAEPTKAPEPTVTPTPKPTDTPAPTPTPVKETRDMYRLYNPNSGEHFYTGNEAEKDGLVKLGWKYEGVGWKAPTSGKAVYRLYNPNAGDHHYTLSVTERDYLVSVGWKYEGIGWYSDPEESVPLYRQYNPNAKTGAHNFTTSKEENDHLISLGWKQEGVGWYGVK